MYEICVTRFNNKTFEENKEWIKKNNYTGCIYGTPVKISGDILPETDILVLEMNNDKNIIEGIGFIKNKIILDKKYKIYSDNNYNRFIYKSIMRIDKKDFTKNDKKVIEVLEGFLFKNAFHFKRGQGIQRLPEIIKKIKNFNFKIYIESMYKKRFIDLNIRNINYKQ